MGKSLQNGKKKGTERESDDEKERGNRSLPSLRPDDAIEQSFSRAPLESTEGEHTTYAILGPFVLLLDLRLLLGSEIVLNVETERQKGG